MFAPCCAPHSLSFSRFRPAGIGMICYRSGLALSNELASRSDKIALSRVLHFCSARGIGPNAVTEENLRRIPPPPRSLASEKAQRDIRYDRKGMAEGGKGDRGLATDWRLDPRSPQAMGFPVGPLSGTAPPGLSSVVRPARRT